MIGSMGPLSGRRLVRYLNLRAKRRTLRHKHRSPTALDSAKRRTAGWEAKLKRKYGQARRTPGDCPAHHGRGLVNGDVVGGAELIYSLITLVVWASIIGFVVYAVRRASKKSAQRDERLAAIERKLDDLREQDRT